MHHVKTAVGMNMNAFAKFVPLLLSGLSLAACGGGSNRMTAAQLTDRLFYSSMAAGLLLEIKLAIILRAWPRR